MPLLDRISDLVTKLIPPQLASKQSTSLSGGIGSGHGMVPFDDNMIVSKPTIIFHASQIFFSFLAMASFAGVASFQTKWGVGPSGLSGFSIFVAVAGMFLSAFMLLVPVAYEKYDKFIQLARTLKEIRVAFILTGTGTTFSLLISFIVTISAWTQPGCKNPDNDPHGEEKGDDFKKGLPGWCNTKKAGAIFFWFAFIFWAASFVFLVLDWRSGKLSPHRDLPFPRPSSAHQTEDDLEEDEDASYTHVPSANEAPVMTSGPRRYETTGNASNPFSDSNGYNPSSLTPVTSTASYNPPLAGRPSMDAYGAFSDPAPSGFGASSGYSNAPVGQLNAYSSPSSGIPLGGPPLLPEPDLGPRVSRTMQYADPYAAVRASIAGQQGPSSPTSGPPSYDSYEGYR